MGGKNKPPAFQLYAGDWIRDQKVILMSNAGRGVYIHLLCSQWLEGTLPDDIEALARICTTQQDEFSKIWPEVEGCFERVTRKRNGEAKTFLINKRLEAERKKKQKYLKEQSEKGKEGARKRWGDKEPTSNGDNLAMPEPKPKDGSSSSTSSSTSFSNIDVSIVDDVSKTKKQEHEAIPEGDLEEIDAILWELRNIHRFPQSDVESYRRQVTACGYGLRHFRHAYAAYKDALSKNGDNKLRDGSKYFQACLKRGTDYKGGGQYV